MMRSKLKPATDQTASRRPPWHTSHGTYLAGRAAIDEADHAAAAMEDRWGVGRLRLLVGPELREKFDRQRYLFNRAIWHGELEDVRREAGRMIKAWRAADAAAEQGGATRLEPHVLEVALSDGRVVAIVPDEHHASAVSADGRQVDVYTLAEIGRLIEGFPAIAKIKHAFPGATVTYVRPRVRDPLDAIETTVLGIDEVIDDQIGF